MRILTVNSQEDYEILTAKSNKITNIEDALILAEHMKETIKKTNDAVGLAAPQVGHNVKMFVAKLGNKLETCINPKIVRVFGKKYSSFEGCLSIPDNKGFATRYKQILVSYHNGIKEVPRLLKGLDAKVFQHETDHLNGVLLKNLEPRVKKIV